MALHKHGVVVAAAAAPEEMVNAVDTVVDIAVVNVVGTAAVTAVVSVAIVVDSVAAGEESAVVCSYMFLS